MILDLSRDDVGKIESLICDIDDINEDKIIADINSKENLTHKIISINKKLRDSLSEEDAEKYRAIIDNLKLKLQLSEDKLEQVESANETAQSLLSQKETEREKLHKQILDNAHNKHVYELSDSITKIMNSIITDKTVSIRKMLAQNTVKNLNQIYRKNNLISKMQINDDFRFDLYQNQEFTLETLKSFIANIGISDFIGTIDESSKQMLFDYFNVSSASTLKNAIENCNKTDTRFELNKKIKLGMLSKGERQIFILALYWAIIQISNKSIPFIIDTPYARIDANHREEISRKFFPYISEQVVILSTDEEITQEYYNIIKQFISKEYLLTNNQNENRTTISEGYFFRKDNYDIQVKNLQANTGNI